MVDQIYEFEDSGISSIIQMCVFLFIYTLLNLWRRRGGVGGKKECLKG